MGILRNLEFDNIIIDETLAPFFQNGATSGFEMCFGPSTLGRRTLGRRALGARAKTRLESRIKKFTPHCILQVLKLIRFLRLLIGTTKQRATMACAPWLPHPLVTTPLSYHTPWLLHPLVTTPLGYYTP